MMTNLTIFPKTPGPLQLLRTGALHHRGHDPADHVQGGVARLLHPQPRHRALRLRRHIY